MLIVEWCIRDDITTKVNRGGTCYALPSTGHVPVVITSEGEDESSKRTDDPVR